MRKTIYADNSDIDAPLALVTVEAGDHTLFIQVDLDDEPAKAGPHGRLYFTRDEAKALADALLWASAEASD
jgi:hypothetical protein